MADRELVSRDAGPLAVSDTALVEDWTQWLRDAEGAAESTISAYRRSVDKFRQWLQQTGQAGIVTPETVVSWKAALLQEYAPQTVNLRLSALRSFYRYLVSSGRLPVNPTSEVKGAKQSRSRQHKRDPLSNGEVLAVLETCDTSAVGVRDRALLTLMAFCGLRTIEVHRADVTDLRTKDDRLVLEVQGKGSTEPDRVVVIPQDQETVIRAWLAERSEIAPGDGPLFVSLSRRSMGDRLSLRAIRGMVKERYRLAGVAGEGRRKTAHSLRHSAITNAIRHGAAPLQVQAMTGHSSFDTTLVYYHEVERIADPAEDLISYGG
jgi:site-specific recombinase XerD